MNKLSRILLTILILTAAAAIIFTVIAKDEARNIIAAQEQTIESYKSMVKQQHQEIIQLETELAEHGLR